MRTQWRLIEKQLRARDDETEESIVLCKAFYDAGWEVYPESGYRFQKREDFEDGSFNEACISEEDALLLAQKIKESRERLS